MNALDSILNELGRLRLEGAPSEILLDYLDSLPSALKTHPLVLHERRLAAAGSRDEARVDVPSATSQLANAPQHADETYKALVKRGRILEAAELFEAASRVNPAATGLSFLLGSALLLLGRFEGALEAFTKSAEIEPSPGAFANIGVCQIRLHRLKEALVALHRSIELGASPSAYNNCSDVLMEMGRRDEAEEAYRCASDRAQGDPQPQALRAQQMIVDGDVDSAIRILQAVVRTHPDFPLALWVLGNAYLTKRDHHNARTTWEQVVALRADDPTAWGGLGYSRLLGGDLDGALDAFRTSVDLEPASAPAQAGLATVLSGLDRHTEAMEGFERALTLDPESLDQPEIQAALARTSQEVARYGA